MVLADMSFYDHIKKNTREQLEKFEMDIKSLNDRQKNAVLTIGPMLVFAGAGVKGN